MAQEKKNEGRTGITTRYTSEEVSQLDWLAERWGCDRANAPRQVMSAYLTAHPDLYDQYKSSQQNEQ